MKYMHGGNGFEYGNGVLDFSANINPLGTPEHIKEAVIRSLDKLDRYPDYQCTELRNAIARREGVPACCIVCGNGAAELIYSLVYSIRPHRALIHAPTFSEYAEAVNAAGGTVSESGGEIEFICNPNNPTGQLTGKAEIEARLRSVCGLLVVDECFNDFLDEPAAYSCTDLIQKYKRLVILKSFTKMYAMPGIRLGYLMTSDERIIEGICHARQPWSVSSAAQAAGLAACGDIKTPELARQYIRAERTYLETEFSALGLQYRKPTANYIFFKAEPGLKDRLLEKNILIRSCSDYEGLEDGCFRIGIRRHEDNERLIRALREVAGWQKQL